MENVVSVEDDYLEFPEFAIEGGENVIFTILEARYPDKDPTDRAGKALFDVFEVSAREGEHLREWSAGADSVFHAGQRDAEIAFPDMIKATTEVDEVREVLASAWKQERQEISKEKLRRGFGRPSKSAANPATRKFRTEVEELKLRTMCNRCGNFGHWARECPQKRVQSNKGGGRGGYSARKNEYFPKEN